MTVFALLSVVQAHAADATGDASAAANATTKLDATGDITITPPKIASEPTKIKLITSGKAVTTPTEKKKSAMTVADFLSKIASARQWKVTYMPAAARLSAQTITIPDAPKSAKSADDTSKATDDSADDGPKPVDVTTLDDDQIWLLLRAANLIRLKDSSLQSYLRESGGTVSAEQLQDILRSLGHLEEGVAEDYSKHAASKSADHWGRITPDEAAMLANMRLRTPISKNAILAALVDIASFNSATYHIGSADGELVVMRHGKHNGNVADVCRLADFRVQTRIGDRQEQFSEDLEEALSAQVHAFFLDGVKKYTFAVPRKSSPILDSEGKPKKVASYNDGGKDWLPNLAALLAADLQSSWAPSGDDKSLKLSFLRLATGRAVGLIENAIRQLTPSETSVLMDATVEDVRKALVPMLRAKLMSLQESDYNKVADNAVKEIKAKVVDVDAIVRGSLPASQSRWYDKASLTLTKRSPEAALVLNGLLNGGTLDNGLRIELQPLDGDGRFLVYFPLEHAWSQQSVFARPYASSSTDPTLTVNGLVDLVKSAVGDYSGDAGIPPDVSAKLVPDPGLDVTPVVPAFTLPKGLSGGTGNDGPKVNISATLDSALKKIVENAVGSLEADLDPAFWSQDYQKWLLTLRALAKSPDKHAANLTLLRIILPPPGYKIGGDIIFGGGAAPGKGSDAKGAEDVKSSADLGSEAITLVNKTTMGKVLYGLAPDAVLKVETNGSTTVGSASATVPVAIPVTATAPVVLGPSAAPRGSRIPTLFAGQVNADVANNALVVVCPPFDPDPAFGFMTFLDGLMSRLDEPLRMIEISVAIVDLQSTKGEDWGTSFATVANGQIGNKPAFGVAGYNLVPNSTSTTPNPVSGSLSPTSSGAVPALSSDTVAGQGIAVSGLVVGSTVKLLASFHALETANEAQMLARPSVLTTDNSEAIITEETKLYLSAKGLNTGVLTEVPSGLAVAVTPQIVMLEDKVGEKREAVRMRIKIKEGGSDPVASQGIVAVDNSQLKTMAVVEKNQSLLVAGRLHRDESNVDSHIPVLGRIPLLGRAFKNTTLSKNRNQRLVLITPTIVDPRTYHSEAANQAAESMLVPAGQSVLDSSLFPRGSVPPPSPSSGKKTGK